LKENYRNSGELNYEYGTKTDIENLAEHLDYTDKKTELRNILMNWLIDSNDTGLKGDLRWQSARTKFIKNHLPRPAQ